MILINFNSSNDAYVDYLVEYLGYRFFVSGPESKKTRIRAPRKPYSVKCYRSGPKPGTFSFLTWEGRTGGAHCYGVSLIDLKYFVFSCIRLN